MFRCIFWPNVLPKNKFHLILLMFHLNDKWLNIRGTMTMMLYTKLDLYYSELWKHHLQWLMRVFALSGEKLYYMAQKLNIYGIKIFMVADSKSSYSYNCRPIKRKLHLIMISVMNAHVLYKDIKWKSLSVTSMIANMQSVSATRCWRKCYSYSFRWKTVGRFIQQDFPEPVLQSEGAI